MNAALKSTLPWAIGVVFSLTSCLQTKHRDSRIDTGANNNILVATVADSGAQKAIKLVVSTDLNTEAVEFCATKTPAECNDKEPTYKSSNQYQVVKDRHYFILPSTDDIPEGTTKNFSINIVNASKQISASRSIGIEGVKELVEFVSIPVQRSENAPYPSPILKDILTHVNPSFGRTYYDSDVETWAHESTHGINSDLRNRFNKTGKTANGFYVLEGRGAIVEEPPMMKDKVAEFVPKSLRNLDVTGRFGTYITGSASWNDHPLYVWDEWCAYTNGSAAAVDIVENGSSIKRDDALSGAMEFTVYAIAVGMAAQKYAPDYFKSNTQFRNFIKFNTTRAMGYIKKGLKMKQFANPEVQAYFDKLKKNTDPDVETFRKFTRDTFGADWANSTLYSD